MKSRKLNVSIQTPVSPREYKSIAITSELVLNEQRAFYTIPAWLATVVVIVVCIWTFIYGLASQNYDSNDLNIKQGVILGIAGFILLGIFYFPHSAMQRPCPLFWNILFSLSILYMIFLCFLISQSPTSIRRIFNFIANDTGLGQIEGLYAQDCRVFTPEHPTSLFNNIREKADFYISAHFFGWYIKMFIIRDVRLCLIVGTVFEFLQGFLSPWLPNFEQCWWDHYVFDLLGANTFGVYFAYIQMRMTNVHFFDWTSDDENTDKKIRIKYGPFVAYWIQLFHYKNWRIHHWKLFNSFPRFAGTLFISCLILLVDMNNFFGKHFIYIPADHWLLIMRVCLWGLCAIASVRELFDFVMNPAIKKLGQQMFVCTLSAFIELGIILKMYNGEFADIQLDKFSLYCCYLAVSGIIAYLLFLGVPEFLKWLKRVTGINHKFNYTNPRVKVFEDVPGLTLDSK